MRARVERRQRIWGRAARAGGWAFAACLGLFAAGATSTAAQPVDGGQDLAGAHGGRHRRDRLPKGTVWVVNRDEGGSLTIFDAASGDVLRTLTKVGAGAHDICLAERAGTAFVMAESVNAVMAIDTETLDVEAIPVTPGPHHCETSPDGRTLYVSLSAHTAAPGAPQLAVIDVDDHSVEYMMTSANVTGARAHGPSLSADGDTLYVAHDVGNEVTAVDLESGDIVLSVPGIVRAEETVATNDGHWLWASSRGAAKVLRIDLRHGGEPRSLTVGGEPESVMLTPSEHVLAVSLRTTATVVLVDTRRLSVLASVPLATQGACGASDPEKQGLGDLAVMSPDGRYVFATFDHGSGCVGGVSVVDVRTRQVVATWPYPGNGRPHGIAYSRRKPRFPVP